MQLRGKMFNRSTRPCRVITINVIDFLGDEVTGMLEKDLKALDREETDNYVRRLNEFLLNE